MTEIKLVKRYPHIKDEDVTSIFQEGYIKGFENGRKGAIPVEWIEKYAKRTSKKCCHCATAIWEMLEDWEKENATEVND